MLNNGILLLRRTPVALNGIAISLITLANIYSLLGLMLLADIIFVLATIIFIINALKCIIHNNVLISELDNYIQGGYVPLFSMFLATLAYHLYKSVPLLSNILWSIAFILHTALLIYLYYSHYRQKNFTALLPSWFIPPIGFIAIGLGASSINALHLGKYIFIFADIIIIPLSIMIIRRQIVDRLNDSELYTTGIYAAPLSLLILALIHDKDITYASVQLEVFFYLNIVYNLFSLVGMIMCLRRKFSPGLASFTFPFAISALANYQYQDINHFGLYLAYITLSIASIMTLYVTTRMIITPENRNIHK